MIYQVGGEIDFIMFLGSLLILILGIISICILALQCYDLCRIAQLINKFKPRRRVVIQPKYPPYVLSSVDIPDDVQGIVAVRQWRVSREGMLVGPNTNYVWVSDIVIADGIPTKTNFSGIYAYIPERARVTAWDNLGIVALTGKCVGYRDGMVRAERCQVLTVICRGRESAERISANYGIPTVYSKSVRSAFREWLIGNEGIYWLHHNRILLMGSKPDKLTQEVSAILQASGF